MSDLSDEQAAQYRQARLHTQYALDEITYVVRMVSKKCRDAR